MPNETRIVAPGPSDRSVRTGDGQILQAPSDWELLPPGDAAMTRRVKAAGPNWTVQQKKGRKVFSLGVWAPAERIASIRVDLESERSTDAYAKRRAADKARRERKQSEYVEDFRVAVLTFLDFAALRSSPIGMIFRLATRTSKSNGRWTSSASKSCTRSRFKRRWRAPSPK